MARRRGWATLALFLVVAMTTASAHAEEPSGGAQKATIAPPPAEGDNWRVIQFPNGYARFSPAQEEGEGAESGGVTIEPEPARTTTQLRSGDQQPPEGGPPVLSGPMPPPPPPEEPCLREQQLLAQRLLYLRGVRVDPQSALLAWNQLELPLTPYLALAMFGRPTPLVGGSFLVNVLSWDQTTQRLMAELAECEGGVPIGAGGY